MDVVLLGMLMIWVIIGTTGATLITLFFKHEGVSIGWSVMTIVVGLACIGMVFTGVEEYKKKNDVYPCKMEEVQ